MVVGVPAAELGDVCGTFLQWHHESRDRESYTALAHFTEPSRVMPGAASFNSKRCSSPSQASKCASYDLVASITTCPSPSLPSESSIRCVTQTAHQLTRHAKGLLTAAMAGWLQPFGAGPAATGGGGGGAHKRDLAAAATSRHPTCPHLGPRLGPRLPACLIASTHARTLCSSNFELTLLWCFVSTSH